MAARTLSWADHDGCFSLLKLACCLHTPIIHPSRNKAHCQSRYCLQLMAHVSFSAILLTDAGVSKPLAGPNWRQYPLAESPAEWRTPTAHVAFAPCGCMPAGSSLRLDRDPSQAWTRIASATAAPSVMLIEPGQEASTIIFTLGGTPQRHPCQNWMRAAYVPGGTLDKEEQATCHPIIRVFSHGCSCY